MILSLLVTSMVHSYSCGSLGTKRGRSVRFVVGTENSEGSRVLLPNTEESSREEHTTSRAPSKVKKPNKSWKSNIFAPTDVGPADIEL